MKKSLAAIVLLAFTMTACTGSFNLTKKVYNFHRSQSDKWADELCFLVVALTPVYGFATFADAIVFNSIEFWTGENPVVYNSTEEPQIRLVKQGGDELLVAYDAKTDQITVAPMIGDAQKEKLVLERNAEMVLAKNTAGDVLFSSVRADDGGVSVYDAEGKLMKSYSPQQIAALKSHLSK